MSAPPRLKCPKATGIAQQFPFDKNYWKFRVSTASLGFLLLESPEVCTNQSPLICNKALQRQHDLGEGSPDFSTTAVSSDSALCPKPGRLPACPSIALQPGEGSASCGEAREHAKLYLPLMSRSMLSKSPTVGPIAPSFQKHPN